MIVDVEELIELIEGAGFEAKPYSGRGMMGKECVAAAIDGEADLWELAYAAGEKGADIDPPRIDTLGRGLIAYWPRASWGEEA